MSPVHNSKALTILAFGNSNSGKADVLESLYHVKPTNNENVLASHFDSNSNMELRYSNDGLTYRILDAGGAEDDKEKSISTFEGAIAIMFVVNVADYDQYLPKDQTRNRIQADFNFFNSIGNLPRFKTTPIILFLNNADEFKEKLSSVPMRDFFPDYMEGPEYASDISYFVSKFVGLSPRASDQIYVYTVSETKTNILDFLIEAVKDIMDQRPV